MSEQKERTMEGVVERVVFRNSENGRECRRRVT